MKYSHFTLQLSTLRTHGHKRTVSPEFPNEPAIHLTLLLSFFGVVVVIVVGLFFFFWSSSKIEFAIRVEINWFWSRRKVHFSILIWHRTAACFNFANRRTRPSTTVWQNALIFFLFGLKWWPLISQCDTRRIHISIVELLLKFNWTKFGGRIMQKGDCHRCHWQRIYHQSIRSHSTLFQHTLDLRRRTGAILHDVWLWSSLNRFAPSAVRTEVIKFIIEISNEKCRTRTVQHLCEVVKWMFPSKVNKWHSKNPFQQSNKTKVLWRQEFRFGCMAK